jgi:hypothetical protein
LDKEKLDVATRRAREERQQPGSEMREASASGDALCLCLEFRPVMEVPSRDYIADPHSHYAGLGIGLPLASDKVLLQHGSQTTL